MVMNEKQLEMVEKVGIKFPIRIPLPTDQLFELEDKVSSYLIKYCFDENYEISEEGRVCESILDMLDILAGDE